MREFKYLYNLTYKNKLVNWKNYLIIANSINNPNDPVLTERAKKAVEIFPNSSEIKNLYNQIAVGTNKLNESISYSKIGLEFFNKGDYQNAAMEFEKAALCRDKIKYLRRQLIDL